MDSTLPRYLASICILPATSGFQLAKVHRSALFLKWGMTTFLLAFWLCPCSFSLTPRVVSASL
eukprot:9442222-Heterocapsa_arctica.AAC.1